MGQVAEKPLGGRMVNVVVQIVARGGWRWEWEWERELEGGEDACPVTASALGGQ